MYNNCMFVLLQSYFLSQDGVAGPKGEKGEPGAYDDITADHIAKLIPKLTDKVTLYWVSEPAIF